MKRSLVVNSILKFPTCAAGKHRVFNIELEKKLKYGSIDLTELPVRITLGTKPSVELGFFTLWRLYGFKETLYIR